MVHFTSIKTGEPSMPCYCRIFVSVPSQGRRSAKNARPRFRRCALQDRRSNTSMWHCAIAVYGDWDVGLSHRRHKSRPLLSCEGNELKPYYAQMQHFSWMCKALSVIGYGSWKAVIATATTTHRRSNRLLNTHGLGRLIVLGHPASLLNTGTYDSRGNNAQTIGQNDVFLGAVSPWTMKTAPKYLRASLSRRTTAMSTVPSWKHQAASITTSSGDWVAIERQFVLRTKPQKTCWRTTFARKGQLCWDSVEYIFSLYKSGGTNKLAFQKNGVSKKLMY